MIGAVQRPASIYSRLESSLMEAIEPVKASLDKNLVQRLLEHCRQEKFTETFKDLSELQASLVLLSSSHPDALEQCNEYLLKLNATASAVDRLSKEFLHTQRNSSLSSPVAENLKKMGFEKVADRLFTAKQLIDILIRDGKTYFMHEMLDRWIFEKGVTAIAWDVGYKQTHCYLVMAVGPRGNTNFSCHYYQLNGCSGSEGVTIENFQQIFKPGTPREQLIQSGFRLMNGIADPKLEIFEKTIVSHLDKAGKPQKEPFIVMLSEGKIECILKPLKNFYDEGGRKPVVISGNITGYEDKPNPQRVNISLQDPWFKSVMRLSDSRDQPARLDHIGIAPDLLPAQAEEGGLHSLFNYALYVHTLNGKDIRRFEKEMHQQGQFLHPDEKLLAVMGYDYVTVKQCCDFSYLLDHLFRQVHSRGCGCSKIEGHRLHADLYSLKTANEKCVYEGDATKNQGEEKVWMPFEETSEFSNFETFTFFHPKTQRKFIIDSRFKTFADRLGFYGGRGSRLRISPVHFLQFFDQINPRAIVHKFKNIEETDGRPPLKPYLIHTLDGSSWEDYSGYLFVKNLEGKECMPLIRGLPLACQGEVLKFTHSRFRVELNDDGLVELIQNPGGPEERSWTFDPFDEQNDGTVLSIKANSLVPVHPRQSKPFRYVKS